MVDRLNVRIVMAPTKSMNLADELLLVQHCVGLVDGALVDLRAHLAKLGLFLASPKLMKPTPSHPMSHRWECLDRCQTRIVPS